MLPRKVGNVPSLELFKAMLDGALSKLVYWNVSQPMAKGLELYGLSRSLPTQTVM